MNGVRGRLKAFHRLWLGMLKTYFRIELEGLENLPRRGAAIIAPNHSGFTGFDAVLLAFLIKRATRRRARILAHRAYFDVSSALRMISESLGLKRASVPEGVDTLSKGRLLIVFPEGEAGNFKPTAKKYELQKFHTGFLRMALETRSPIVPCLIIGAEETHLNLGNLNLSRIAKGLRIPLPLNFLPLPAKWRIVFLPPVSPENLGEETLRNERALRKHAREFRSQLQRELKRRLKKRPFIYFEKTGRIRKTLTRKIKGLKSRRTLKAPARSRLPEADRLFP